MWPYCRNCVTGGEEALKFQKPRLDPVPPPLARARARALSLHGSACKPLITALVLCLPAYQHAPQHDDHGPTF